MLVLKILLVPTLIAAITLATRRWGPRIGGFLTALPVVTGPTLCFYAIEQGRIGLGAAAEMASSSPAHFLGLGDRIGAIRAGFRADLIAMRDDFTIARTWIGGAAG